MKRSGSSKLTRTKRFKRSATAPGANGPGTVNFTRLRRAQQTTTVTITRTVASGNFAAGAAGVDAFGAANFQLSQLSNYTDITNMYDEYRIKAVKWYIVPNQPTNTTAVGAASTPVFISSVDYNDSATPTLKTTILQSDTARVHGPLNKMYTRTFKPNVALAAYAGAFTSYANVEDQWIDTGSPNVQHYGIKWGVVDVNNGTNAVSCYTYATFYIELRKAA